MLEFDLDKRISVDEALKHPYLSMFTKNDIDNEKPNKISKFDFLYEDKELNKIQIRELILEEILLYHDNHRYKEYIINKKKYENERKNFKI